MIDLNFIDCQIPKFLLATSHFEGHSLIKWTIVESKTDFGFMSSIYEAKLITTTDGENDYCYNLIIKVMRGSEHFRQNTQSYLQFHNEIYMYATVLPYLKSYLIDKGINVDLSEWLPTTYLSTYVQNEESMSETILVQENIQKKDFYIEPELYLTQDHLEIMIECLAQFHAVSFALKLENNQKFMEVVGEIKPLCFEQPNGSPSLYDVLHDISTIRLFNSVFNKIDLHTPYDDPFIHDINRLKQIVGDKPVKLLDRFREIDEFAVITHGDYHRNNLLFRKINNNRVVNMKMIDFQQVRYGSPCLDLSFFMYLNISCDLRPDLWDRLLQTYHQQFIRYTAEILNIEPNGSVLSYYSYEKFIEHCKRFFLYGALISASFTPWLLTSKEETSKVARLFQEDMFDPEYKKFALIVGGAEANERILGNMIHASEKGYLKILYEL